MSRLIISINRSSSILEAENIAQLAIEYYKKYPDVVVGIELSGEPTLKNFSDFEPIFTKARQAGLKVRISIPQLKLSLI
jgi:adenosine deaminase